MQPYAADAEELHWSEGQIRDFVRNRKNANPHLYNAVGIAEGAY